MTTTAPVFGSAFVGPIHWIAPVAADPHECLLATIKARNEAAPSDTIDAPHSNQVAQRNIEIGNDCSWTLTNGTAATGMSVITIKTLTGLVGGQPYAPAPGDVVKIVFDDPTGQTFAKFWSTPPGANPPYTVTKMNGGTIVQLISTSFVTLPPVPLNSNQTVKVSSQVIPALFSGTTIDLQIGVTVSNGGSSTPAVSNGGSCQATADQAPR